MKKLLLTVIVVLVFFLSSCRSNIGNIDNEAPRITINDYEEEFYLGGAIPMISASCDDDVDEVCTVTTPNYPDLSVHGTHTVTFKATDAAGNTSYEIVTVTAIDRSTFITLSIAEYETTVEVGAHYNLPNTTCVSSESATCNVTLPSPVDTSAQNDNYTYHIIGTDDQGNSKTETITISVVDTTNPTIELVGEASVTYDFEDGWIDPGVTTSDLQAVTVTTETVPNPDTVKIGTFTTTYTATDLAGNTASITRTFTVTDTTSPVVTLLGDAVVTIELGETWEDPRLTVVDTQNVTITQDIIPDLNIVDSYVIIYTITDLSDNFSTIQRTVNVVDTTNPTIALVGDAVVAVELGGTWTDPSVTTADLQNVVVTEDVVPNLNSVGSYVITYTATDDSGNIATVTRTVNVADTTNPTITLVGDAVVAVELGGTWTDPSVTTADLQNVVVTEDIVPDLNTIGTYVITYTATDDSGNTATVTRTVNVADTTDPTITLVGDAIVNLTVGAVWTDPGVTTSDFQSVVVTQDITPDLNTIGVYLITYTATDDSGNTNTVQRTVNVN